MTSIEQADSWIGRTAVDNTGEQIGIITQIWVDDASGQPEWASVRVPSLGGRDALVPLAGTAAAGGGRRFAYSRDEIVDAPHCADDGTFAVEDKQRLAAHYGSPGPAAAPDSATWMDRLEDAADGATVREITALLGNGATAPAPQDPAARKLRGRIGRKAAPSAPKAKRVFRRKSSPADQQPAELSGRYDEESIGH